MYYILSFILAYLWGSILFSALICKAKGINIFMIGSGNAGSTNVARALNPSWAKLVFFLDFFKGASTVALSLYFSKDITPDLVLSITSFIGVALGHSFSCFYRLKGGKAIAVSMGGLAVLCPYVLLIGMLVWTSVFYACRYVSVASMFFGLSLPLSSIILKEEKILTYFSFVLMIFIILLHNKNLKRLWQGTETKS